MTPQEVYEKWTAIGWFFIAVGIMALSAGIYFIIDVSQWIKKQ